jgi:hypothetical protein
MIGNEQIKLESIKFERLIGTKAIGRWLFTLEFYGSNWCCVYQPSLMKYSRAAILGGGGSRTELGEKITANLSEATKELVLKEIEALTKENGLYAKLRRNKDSLMQDFGDFVSSVILQNCRPDDAVISEVENIIRSFFEKGLVKKGRVCDLSFGDHYYGYFFCNKTI